MLLSPATSLGQWFAKKSTSALIAKAVPFVDAALMAFNAAVTAAQLAQTIIEVLDSPFVYETDVVRSLELTVSLTPGDNSYGKFPDHHNKFALTISYDVGTTLPVYVQTLPPETISNDIHVTFSSLPAGGNLNVFVAFYADNGWQSGQGQSGWAPAYGEKGTLTVPVRIMTNDIPLSASSVYVHNEKIGPDSKQNLVWLPYPGKPPTQTLTSPAPYESQGKVVQRWAGITTAQAPEMIGYCWQATGLGLPPDQTGNPPSRDSMWTMQNLSVLQNPQGGWASPKVGFTSPPGIAYDLSSPNDGTGMNFFIDPTAGEFDPDDNRGGGYHARRIALSANGAPTFVTGSNQSYGRFPVAVDRYVYHPQGYLFAISYAAHKIFKLALTSTPVADKDAPQAVMCSGQGERDGLIQGPSTLAVALDGRLLVLEKLNHRIQAVRHLRQAGPVLRQPRLRPERSGQPAEDPDPRLASGRQRDLPGPRRRGPRVRLRALLHRERRQGERLPGRPLRTRRHVPGRHAQRRRGRPHRQPAAEHVHAELRADSRTGQPGAAIGVDVAAARTCARVRAEPEDGPGVSMSRPFLGKLRVLDTMSNGVITLKGQQGNGSRLIYYQTGMVDSLTAEALVQLQTDGITPRNPGGAALPAARGHLRKQLSHQSRRLRAPAQRGDPVLLPGRQPARPVGQRQTTGNLGILARQRRHPLLGLGQYQHLAPHHQLHDPDRRVVGLARATVRQPLPAERRLHRMRPVG